MAQWVIAAILLIAAAGARAESFTGRVVGVSDGDTITVLMDDRQTEKVRLSGIDAPEKGQPFGQRAKQHLSDWCFGKSVTIEWTKRDRYRRVVGKVRVDGVDVNLEMLKAGLAWHYKQYEREQPREERETYAAEEVQAQSVGIGIWRNPAPVAPWDYRASQRASQPQPRSLDHR